MKSAPLPDSIVLHLYKDIILPWETELKSAKGCWNVARTRQRLLGTELELECVALGTIEERLATRTANSSKNFVYFVSNSSQMQDLFRHIRNCAAHAAVQVISRSRYPLRLHFQGNVRGSTQLAISGQLDAPVMSDLVNALVTYPD